MGPSLKLVLLRKKMAAGVTIQERKFQEVTEEQLSKQRAEERKKNSIRLVAEVVAKELERANVTKVNQSGDLKFSTQMMKMKRRNMRHGKYEN